VSVWAGPSEAGLTRAFRRWLGDRDLLHLGRGAPSALAGKVKKAVLAAILLLATSAAADPITYTVGRTVGNISITGFITTDGVLGAGPLLTDYAITLSTTAYDGILKTATFTTGLSLPGVTATEKYLMIDMTQYVVAGVGGWRISGLCPQCYEFASVGGVSEMTGQYVSGIVGVAVPEPNAGLLFGLALGVLGWTRRRA